MASVKAGHAFLDDRLSPARHRLALADRPDGATANAAATLATLAGAVAAACVRNRQRRPAVLSSPGPK
jgi:hypothetical protein